MQMCPAKRVFRLFGKDEEAERWDNLLALLDKSTAELQATVDQKKRELNDER